MFAYYLKLYLATLAAFFAIDILWLAVVAKKFYAKYLGFLMTPSPKWLPAILFYLLFIVGILVFAVLPGLQDNSLKTTLLRGALFGLLCYATYDLTNLATLKDWPLTVTAVDLAWGTLVSTLVSLAGFYLGKWLK